MLTPTTLLPFLSLLNLVFADYTCDTSISLTPEEYVAAISEPAPSSSGSSSGSSGICLYADCPYCDNDPTGLLCDNWHKDILQSGFSSNTIFGKKGKRAAAASSLECADEEACVNIGDTLLCIDSTTLDFEDSTGGSGNIDSDIYTMADGAVTSLASTEVLPSATGTGLADSTATATGLGGTTATAAGAKATASGSASSGPGQVDISAAVGNKKADGVLGMALVAVAAVGVLL
jgi:hypothetical protein